MSEATAAGSQSYRYVLNYIALRLVELHIVIQERQSGDQKRHCFYAAVAHDVFFDRKLAQMRTRMLQQKHRTEFRCPEAYYARISSLNGVILLAPASTFSGTTRLHSLT